MGLFDLFKRKPKRVEPNERPSLIVALDVLPGLDVPALEKSLAGIEPLRLAPRIEIEQTGADDSGVLHGRAEFDSHIIRVVGFDVPAPDEVLERTVSTSAWKGEARERLLGHKAHLVLFHEAGGPDVQERFIALFKLASVLGGDQLAGTIHEAGWTSASAEVLREFTDAERLETMRQALPPVIFFGVLPFREEGEAWIATKGCHLFGAPDLVIEKGEAANPEIFDLLHNIFLYVVKQGATVAPGHTMQFGEDEFLRFEELPEDHRYYDWLKGAGETLLLTRISQDEINQK